MATLGPLYPDSDGTAPVSLEYSTGTSAFVLVNTDPINNPTPTSWVRAVNNTADAELWMGFQNVPANFVKMHSLTARVYVEPVGTRSDDNYTLGIAIANADSSNVYLAGNSATVVHPLVTWNATTTPVTQVYSASFSFLVSSGSATWNNGWVHFHWVKTKTGGWDATYLQVAAVELIGVYTASVAAANTIFNNLSRWDTVPTGSFRTWNTVSNAFSWNQ